MTDVPNLFTRIIRLFAYCLDEKKMVDAVVIGTDGSGNFRVLSSGLKPDDVKRILHMGLEMVSKEPWSKATAEPERKFDA